MAMHPAGLRRNFKNIVHNYSEAQVKVREATSNDPWGPSSTLMCEIADLTYNVVAFSEIMQVIWKRLNDHGKNWRHVYKALVLLEYLIKTGTEKVAQQCKENIFAVQTLKDFQHTEENKDHGIHVREKAKQLVGLLKDDERLKNERARALKAKERFAQSSAGFGSDSQGPFDNSTSRSSSFGQSETTAGDSDFIADSERRISTDLESARPQTAGEEELQLQLALAMSQEEADQEEQRKQSDDVRLQMAITQSAEDFKTVDPRPFPLPQQQHHQPALLDLLDVNMGASTPTSDPWGLSVQQSGGSALHAFCASTTEPSSSPWPPATQDSWHVVVKSTPKDVNVPLNDFKALCISASDNITPLQNLENQSKWPDTPFPEPVTNGTLNVPDACSKLPEFKFWNEETVHKFDVTDLEQTPSPNPAQHGSWKDTPVPDKSSNLTSKSFPSSNLQLLKDLEHIEILQSKNGLTPKINYLLPNNNNCNPISNSSYISKTPNSDLRAWGDAKFNETPLEKSFSKTSCFTPGGNKSNQTFSLVKHSNSVNNISQSSPTISESQEKSPYQKWLCEDIPIFPLFQSTSPTLPNPSVSPENKQTAKPAASSHQQQNDLARKDIVFDPLHSNAASPAIDAWGLPPKPSQPADPWGAPVQEPAADPWSHHPSNQTTPVNPTNQNRPASVTAQPVSHSDPWGPTQDPWGSSNQYGSTPSLATNGELDEFDQITNRPTSSKSTNNLDFLAGGFFDGPNKPMTPQQPPKKTAESFLGENSALVNLDNLVSASATGQPAVGTTPVPTPTPANPFALTPNAFQAQPAPRLTMNQMRTQQQYGSLGAPYMGAPVQQPFMAGPSQQPFMGSPAQQPFMAAQPTPVAFNMTPVSNTTGLTNNPFL